MKHEQDERDRKDKHKHQCHETAQCVQPFLKLRDTRFEMRIRGFILTSLGIIQYTHTERLGEVGCVFKHWTPSTPIFEQRGKLVLRLGVGKYKTRIKCYVRRMQKSDRGECKGHKLDFAQRG